MTGTLEGGRKAAATNLKKYGPDFYRNIGREGGKAGHTGGFAASQKRAKWAGRLGGRLGMRGYRLIEKQVSPDGKKVYASYENKTTGAIVLREITI